MDEIELPPLPSSHASPRTSSWSLSSRKRSRSDYETEPATSSDPALFSSDDPAPSAEQYSAKRRKERWRGTWWGDRLRDEAAKQKRQFKRNYDSGIWMGSEGTESSLEEEFLSDQRNTVPQESFLRDRVKASDGPDTATESTAALSTRRASGHAADTSSRVRPNAAAENVYLARARAVIQRCVEAGDEDVDLSSTLGGDLPAEILQPLRLLTKCSAIREPPASQEAFASLEVDLRIFLANNSLSRLPSVLFDFGNLRVLSLRHNNLTEIPQVIGRLTNLESLNVSNNKLRHLPYELLELIRFGKLLYLLAEPNPWTVAQPAEMRNHTDSSHPRVLPLEKGVMQKTAESLPVYFRHDGTPLAATELGERNLPLDFPEGSTLRSLTQATLLSCYKQHNLAELPEWLLDNLPPNVRKLLELARDVQLSGGRFCTTCRREMVITRKQWIEWWSLSSCNAPSAASDKAYPFLHRQCGLTCTETARPFERCRK